MDRQKSIPPLSTKITRKLAQESADHNTLMNFYSQISRDETGAPKKWKMSSTPHIDEDSIKGKKAGTSKGSSGGSNKGTPTSSRENSNERKSRINQSLQKGSRKGSFNRDGSSSEQSSSRESSLENKVRSGDKKLKKLDKGKKNRSFSSESGKSRKSVDSGSSTSSDTGKKKRGRRPKSLDLSPKVMANGDDDNFKSPDPLTPCNIAIKRKKGRPKETPPVLYAEPPVETSPVENMTDYETEDSSPPLKRKPGRPKKVKKFKTDQLKSLGKSEKLKFNMKRFEGRGLKQYSSKIIKSNLPKGFRRMNKLPKLTPVMSMNENNKDDGSMSSYENDESNDKAKVKENGIPSEKRKRGRPPGAKNKKYYAPLTMLKTRAKAVKSIVSRHRSQFGSQSLKKAISRGPGRPPGARNKTTLQRLASKDKVMTDKVETISNSSKENNSVADKEEIPVPVEKEVESKMEVNAIDEAIEAVVFKARNDISLESNIKPRVPFRATGFYKKLSSVKSVAKIKKEKDIMHKIRKKRIIESHASGGEFTNQIETLASNDLRRKLQSKLIQKMNTGNMQTSTKPEVVSKEEVSVQKTETSLKESDLTTQEVLKTDSLPSAEDSVEKREVNGNIPSALIEEKTIIKPDTDSNIDNAKNVRKPNLDVAKFSDTESVCSELSTVSIGSLKRNIEKQVLILGEENIDSDDQTVRTRQRFEIIPGKKRKRTLSGEFDLLDEKQLRKERKKAEKGLTDDESDANQVGPVIPIKKPLFKRKKSPNKKSPNLKVKDGKIRKKYVSQLTAYRNRMLKQSPFLSRVRKKRRKPLIKRTPEKNSSENVTKSHVMTIKTVGTNESDECNQKTLKRLTEQTEEKITTSLESPTVKSENYRQGLFEKFTDVTLDNKADSVKEIEVDGISEKCEDDADSDDTECTIELKDQILNEDHDEIQVEESVDDSDTIDFHAEVEIESTGKPLYTESEIELREMLFELIDDIVLKIESKKDSQTESTDLKNCDEKVEAKSGNANVEAKNVSDRAKTNDCQKIVEEKSCEEKEESLSKETVDDKCVEEKEVEPSEKVTLSCKNENEVSDEHLHITETEVEKTVKVVSDDEAANEKDNAINMEVEKTVNVDNELTVENEGESKNVKKAKIKKRKRFVPLSMSKRKQSHVATDTKVRKKPGRKPGRKPKQKDLSGDDLSLSTGNSTEPLIDKKTSTAESKSPETGVTRKFELRQKISRSPLDNIALKQSLEENEYLRNEAQKLSRKEAKFKQKAKTPGTDSLEPLPIESKDTNTPESTVSEISEQPVVESVVEYVEEEEEEEEIVETVEEMLKRCRPCKIVLKDFIKELERAQGQPESSCESEADTQDIQDNSDEEKISSPFKHSEDVEKHVDITQPRETHPPDTVESSLENVAADNKDIVVEKSEMPENRESTVNNEHSFVKESKECDQIKTADNSESPKHNRINENVIEISDNKSATESVSPDIKQRELRPKRKTPVKNENISPLKSAVTPSKKVRKIKSINEQQTARKTVPPLKIKVKGGFSSRRKTYIVEPSPDSPVEQSSKDEQKTEKKKEKSKTKSGNKSESSDSEKHSKNHHHHRKKNKTPTEDLISEQNKIPTVQPLETSGNISSFQPEKPAIKATDAYEATFLQFIQDKDKVEQNMAAFSSSLGPRNKSSSQSMQKILQKDNKFMKSAMTSTKAIPKNIPANTKFSSAAVISDTQNDADNSEVQYVCSQCDNVVYKAKEQIIQHYRDVHPGSQFIYKPLPETAENITAISEDGSPKAPQTEHKMDDSVNVENVLQSSTEENEPTNDDEDSGSLNLKIVDVVSLKDQENILDSDTNVSKEEQVAHMHSIHTNQIQTQLRIPSYPVLANAPPPYPLNCSVPPPPYSIATASAISAIQEQLKLKAQQAPVKQKTQIPSGKIASSFKCEKCNVHAPMLAAMVAHLRNSHREIPRLFQCPYCKDMEAETEALIHQHIKKHHPTNNPNPPVALSEPAKRNLKTLSVKLPEGLKLGEGNSIEKDIYMCLKCKEHMPSLETIYEHLEHEHAEIFAYVCPVCKVFKSKSEELVNNHIVINHHRRPAEVNVSLAIDGNHFVRVQCLVKDKTKSGQKSTHSVQQKQQPSPVLMSTHQSKSAMQVPQQTATTLQLQPIPQTVVPQESPVLTQGNLNANPLNPLPQTSFNNPTPVASKPTVQGPKKKKSLLESIQKIKVQKMEQQGLLPQKSGASVSSTIPSHPSQLNSVKPNTAPGAVPPPLMRGPPPLIRYDQLNKVTSPQSVMFGSTVRTSSQFALQNHVGLTNLQKLQNITSSQNAQLLTGAARPIQSSLFDTSDLDSVKSQQSQRPVLNVPVVSRLSNKSPFSQVPSTSSTPENMETTTTGSPLDLSKTTPSASPVPQNALSLNPGQVHVSGAGLNPEVFQVFNLRPSTQMQLPRQQVPVPQMIAQPIMLPQQVRQNTPSTLAYRPAGSQMIATSQVQQLIGMPVGTAVIGNMVVSLGNVSQGIPAMPVVNPALQNAQFVRMSAPQIPASAVPVLNSSDNIPVATQVQSKTSGIGQPVLSKATLFRCPYCPNITPLRFDQVQTHIENKHPGSSVLFKPFETR